MPLRFVAFVVGQFVNLVGCRVGPLPKSRREKISEWTSFSVAERVRYFRIKPILCN